MCRGFSFLKHSWICYAQSTSTQLWYPKDLPYNLCIPSLILFSCWQFVWRFYDELPAAVELINDCRTLKDLKLLLRLVIKRLETLRRRVLAPIEDIFEDVLRSLDEIRSEIVRCKGARRREHRVVERLKGFPRGC